MNAPERQTIVRAIQGGDWPGIDAVQRACFPASAIESCAALRSIADAAPELCLVAAAADGEVHGYLLAHPWIAGELPPLGEVLEGIPAGATDVFIHDLALLPTCRGAGLAGSMVRRMLDAATVVGQRSASLLSVQGTHDFWRRFGFVERPELTRKFANRVRAFYDLDFRTMTADLAQAPAAPGNHFSR